MSSRKYELNSAILFYNFSMATGQSTADDDLSFIIIMIVFFSYIIPERWKYELEALIPHDDRIVSERFSHEFGRGILPAHYCMPGAPITLTHTHAPLIYNTKSY